MDRYQLYAKSLVSLIIFETIILFLTCYYLEPPAGDTTRLSGYSENDFGWNLPQKAFNIDATPLLESYEGYVDVLVVGDSFSFGGNLEMMNYPWQTYLAQNTGLTVSTFSHYTTKTNPPSYDPTLIPRIVNSETFIKYPPKLFVLEVVERQLNLLPKLAGDCKIHNVIDKIKDIKLDGIRGKGPSLEIKRNKSRPSLHKQLSNAKKYLDTVFHVNNDDRQAFLFKLNREKLFSSKVNNVLLVYEGDVKKKNWSNNLIDDIKCRLIDMQNLVQANGETFFIVMIAPDKLTAYSPFLVDEKISKVTVIDRLTSGESLHAPRFDVPLQSAISNGEVDVYLPNDTHWASKGQQIAAETLINYIKKSKMD